MESVKISYGEWNYLKDDGSYLLDKHVYYCDDFYEGFGNIKYIDDTENFVNTDSKKLLKTNVQHCINFHNGFAQVLINDVWYKIDKECNFYNDYDNVPFEELYYEYPNMRCLLIEIIDKYTYFNVEEYFV